MQMVMNIYEDINEDKGIKHPEGLLMLCLKTTLTDQGNIKVETLRK